MQVLHCAPYRDAEGKPHWEMRQHALDTLGPDWTRALESEDTVIEILANHLDDDYTLICNALLLEDGPDADLILVGPNGVWAGEFVHLSGDFKASGENWLAYDSARKDYTPAEPNPIATARANAGVIHEYLHSKDLPVPWVNPVVFLTDPHNINVYGESPAVAIIRREEIYQFVTQEVRDLDPVMDEADVAAIVEVLRPYFTASAAVEAARTDVKEPPKHFLGMSSVQWAILLALALADICVLGGFAWYVLTRQ